MGLTDEQKTLYRGIIIEALKKVGLDEDQASPLVEPLLKRLNFLDSSISQNSTLFDYNRKITDTARRMGVSKEIMAAAALKQPSLFSQSPETLERHARLLDVFERLGLVKKGVKDHYIKNPSLLSLSESNLLLRLAFARLTGFNNISSYGLLKIGRKELEADYVEALGFPKDVKKIDISAPGIHASLEDLNQLVKSIDLKLLGNYSVSGKLPKNFEKTTVLATAPQYYLEM
ncbi:MAG: hypothetical protein KAJ40_02260 [Alphaproteobacteria bacterium]|nr:hypothetical protein [Alphaproteobacteria bacterium]